MEMVDKSGFMVIEYIGALVTVNEFWGDDEMFFWVKYRIICYEC